MARIDSEQQPDLFGHRENVRRRPYERVVGGGMPAIVVGREAGDLHKKLDVAPSPRLHQPPHALRTIRPGQQQQPRVLRMPSHEADVDLLHHPGPLGRRHIGEQVPDAGHLGVELPHQGIYARPPQGILGPEVVGHQAAPHAGLPLDVAQAGAVKSDGGEGPQPLCYQPLTGGSQGIDSRSGGRTCHLTNI